MTAPATAAVIEELFAEVAPVDVTPWTAGDVILDDKAVVLTGEPFGQYIVFERYHEGHNARAHVCPRHGLQRHDRRGAGWRCVKCAATGGRKATT